MRFVPLRFGEDGWNRSKIGGESSHSRSGCLASCSIGQAESILDRPLTRSVSRHLTCLLSIASTQHKLSDFAGKQKKQIVTDPGSGGATVTIVTSAAHQVLSSSGQCCRT